MKLYEDIPREKREELIKKVAGTIVSFGMGVPAIFLLEMHKPLSFIGSQVLIFLEPLVRMVFQGDDYHAFAVIMERRENVEKLIQEIERLEKEREGRRCDTK